MADFDLVDQLTQLRQSFDAPPTALSSYLPPQAPDLAPSAPAGGAPVPSDGNWGASFQGFERQFGKVLRQTSGYRDAKRNAEVNGVPNSWHMKGTADNPRAKDYVGSAGDMQRGAAWAKTHGAREVLIHNAGSGQHLHVAW